MTHAVDNGTWLEWFDAGKTLGLRWLDAGRSRAVLRQIADPQPDACESAREQEIGKAFRAGVAIALAERCLA